MGKTKTLLVLTAILAGLTGCSEQNPLGTSTPDGDQFIARVTGIVPDSVQSATLYLFCSSPSMQAVDIHRVNAPWTDTATSWNSFNAAYETNIDGSFLANVPGWLNADITPLVRGWIGGSYQNYGLLLDQQVSSLPRGLFFSSDNPFSQPYLLICYAGPNGDTCEQFPVASDLYINQALPDGVDGSAQLLFTGYSADGGLEYQSLVRFDLPVYTPPPSDDSTVIDPGDTTIVDPGGDTTIVDDSTVIVIPDDSTTDNGCTRGRAWWMRHAGCGKGQKSDDVSPLLPLWLGNPNGEHSIEISDNCRAFEILHQRPRIRCALWLKPLLAELLAAKLNIAGGADDSDIASVILAVDAFVAAEYTSDRKSANREQLRRTRDWKRALHQFNVGEIGPGSCDLELNRWVNVNP